VIDLHIKSFRPPQLSLFGEYFPESEQVDSTFQHVGDGSEGESLPSLETEGDLEEQEAEGYGHEAPRRRNAYNALT